MLTQTNGTETKHFDFYKKIEKKSNLSLCLLNIAVKGRCEK